MTITLSSGPASEPVTLTEAKTHLRVDHSDSDTEITAMITAAREVVEEHLNLDLGERTWVYTLESFSDPIDLPKSPVNSITSIQYVDTDGATQTLASSVYTLDGDSVYLAYDQSWPSVRDQRAAITITFVTGGDDIAQAVKHAILLTIAEMHENREATTENRYAMSDTVKWLLATYRRRTL